MDPAITAAIVATLTAVAAYAGARSQARSARRGPIDAVRRQHQRDAYAELTRAAWSYAAITGSVQHLVEVALSARLYPTNIMASLDILARSTRVLDTPGFSSDDLAEALAPISVPEPVVRALGRLITWSPTWQQDIRDACGDNQIDELVRAEVVVALEGPDQLAALVEQLKFEAEEVQLCWARAAAAPFQPSPAMEAGRETSAELHTRLKAAIREFTLAARTHLNTQ
ncbi:hypothetical protein AB0D62_38240 [Streptomyces massasporeus]|uniref:hypothetical protein n=1 Tax=Streptomyces massasporeus TaxID=67324 RepID=UPI0033CB939E